MKFIRRPKEGINHWNEATKIKEADLLLRYQEKSTALISECGNYRYQLERVWDNAKPKVMFIMLNPSTADGKLNDPTIRRCMAFAQSWGYGGLMVGNLFAYRSTSPTELLKVNDPVGSKNCSHLNWMAYQCEIIVFAWGNSPILKKLKHSEQLEFLKTIKRPKYYIEQSIDGTPKHPLYLPKNIIPQIYH